jgi:hypothetical protein
MFGGSGVLCVGVVGTPEAWSPGDPIDHRCQEGVRTIDS